MTTILPPTVDEIHRVRAALDGVFREVYPEVRMPSHCVYDLLELSAGGNLPDLDLLPEGIGRKVRQVLDRRGELGAAGVLGRLLEKHLSVDRARQAEVSRLLADRIGSILEQVCRIDRRCFRQLWRHLVAAHDGVTSREGPTRLVLNLADAFHNAAESGSPTYVEDVVCGLSRWRENLLPPTVAHAIGQYLRLAERTGSVARERLIKLALRTADFELAGRLVQHDPSRSGGEQGSSPISRVDRFNTLVSSLEGMLLYLGGELTDYLDSLERLEREYHSLRPPPPGYGVDPDGRPLLSTLRTVEARAHLTTSKEDPAHLRLDPYTCMYLSRQAAAYRGLELFLPVMLFVDTEFYTSRDGQRVMEQADRWCRYRVCDGHRYGRRQETFRPEEVTAVDLLREVIATWHQWREEPDRLLEACRQLQNTPPASSWAQDARDPERHSDAAFRMLPLWLLELRALRLFGRTEPQWKAANRLAVERFGFLACRVDLHDWWIGDPAKVLLTLEAVRQLAVARGESTGRGVWDQELVRCARQILVRLETINDPGVRRALSCFAYPVLTAIAAHQCAVGADPLEGLCLFEMARSRWLLDHLSLGERTLRVHPDDDEELWAIRDELFERLNPAVSPAAASRWGEPGDELLRRLRARRPELARLVSASWLGPAGVRDHMPSRACLLAYHLEHDPAVPPVVRLQRPDEPWPQEPPGDNAELWAFLCRDGACYTRRASVGAAQIREWAYGLENANRDRLLATPEGQPGYPPPTPEEVERYEGCLARLAGVLIHPWEEDPEALFPTNGEPALIVPTGKLFELPWAALPLKDGRRLIDAVVPGVMPGLGLALWTFTAPEAVGRAGIEVFVQVAPDSPDGLHLPKESLDHLRVSGARIVEGAQATPERALRAFSECYALGFLCHGLADGGPRLQLSPPGRPGQLTARQLARMRPADHVRAVLLGACWSGLHAGAGADEVDGLASALLFRGVQAVLAGIGWVPVDLIGAVVARVLAGGAIPPSAGEVARRVRQVQLEHRRRVESEPPNPAHPASWSSINFHGVPW